jgi:hypothetical protein
MSPAYGAGEEAVSLFRGWLQMHDLNMRPLGYEPSELPDCSNLRYGWG